MLKRSKCLKILMLSAVSAVLCTTDAFACAQPVFRYALERWSAEPYQLTVIHEGPFDPDIKARIEGLCPSGNYSFMLHNYDVAEGLPKGTIRQAWEKNPDSERLPFGLMQLPHETNLIWQGKLDPEGAQQLKNLIYSPPVVDVIRSICQGDTAAWLLILGPDQKENQEMRQMLESELSAIEKKLKLPHELDAMDSEYDTRLAPGIPMKLKFSVIECDLNAPESALLKSNLHAWRPETMKKAGAKVIPVFARGRALYIFTTDDLDRDIIRQVCEFLSGSCSCRVKALNPGFDLAMPFPWDEALWEPELNIEKLIASISPPPDVKEPISLDEPVEENGFPLQWIIIGGIALIIVLALLVSKKLWSEKSS